MVTHDDLMNDNEYNDIREDVRLECMEFGPVREVVIPRVKDGFNAAWEGYIYVEFVHVETAKIAAMALNGRKFADRSVLVTYVSITITLVISSFDLTGFLLFFSFFCLSFSLMKVNLPQEYFIKRISQKNSKYVCVFIQYFLFTILFK
jgi:RNA recognition motif-containing protein